MLRSPTASFGLRSGLAAALLALASLAAHAAQGEVKKVDAAKATVKIEHEGIKKLDMPAMAMVFKVQDASLLEGLAAGDRVQFEAEKVDGQYVVTAIKKQ